MRRIINTVRLSCLSANIQFTVSYTWLIIFENGDQHAIIGNIQKYCPQYIYLMVQERLCGILVGAIKSRVCGSENLTKIMYRHELLMYGLKFGIVPPVPSLNRPEQTSPDYDNNLFAFRSKLEAKRRLSDAELRHLRIHYRTIKGIATLQDRRLIDLDPFIETWKRCRVDTTIYHSAQSRRKNSTRLNNLACLDQSIDRNARFSHRTRAEDIEDARFYVYIEYFCVHHFEGRSYMLLYGGYRNTNVHDGLVEDLGHVYNGFTDIVALSHLCARVTGHGKKVYFVDEPEVMEERLRKALGRRS
jgi:hypothetical protein